MKTVTLEMPDELYEIIKRSADASRQPLSEWIVTSLPRLMPAAEPPLTEEETAAAWADLEQHCGAVHLGHATGADNHSIDADLAREYMNNHDNAAGHKREAA